MDNERLKKNVDEGDESMFEKMMTREITALTERSYVEGYADALSKIIQLALSMLIFFFVYKAIMDRGDL